MSTATAAKKIWAESKPLIGSKGEDYFAARGVKPPSPPGCLRFAVRLQHPNQQYFPALVIQATNARTGAPTGGIQRVFLAWSGKGKAQIAKNEQKMSLGPMKGGVARLAEPTDGKPLIVGEGVETVLTPITATDLPGWATFGTSGLKGFNPPDDVKWVVLLAENDGGPNEKALETLIPALKARGIRVAVAKPPPGLKDFNDLVNGTSGHTPEAGLALVKATIEIGADGGVNAFRRAGRIGSIGRDRRRRRQVLPAGWRQRRVRGSLRLQPHRGEQHRLDHIEHAVIALAQFLPRQLAHCGVWEAGHLPVVLFAELALGQPHEIVAIIRRVGGDVGRGRSLAKRRERLVEAHLHVDPLGGVDLMLIAPVVFAHPALLLLAFGDPAVEPVDGAANPRGSVLYLYGGHRVLPRRPRAAYALAPLTF